MSLLPPLVISLFPPVTVLPPQPTITSLPPVDPLLSSSTAIPPASSPGGGGAEGNGSQGASSLNSASLYLYTFLAIVILLLFIAGIIIVRSYALHIRRRREVAIAIQNGTYVPPTPPLSARRARVDLNKKPQLWEAYLNRGGHRNDKKEIDTENYYYYSRDDWEWESIKPIYAGYYSNSTTPLNPFSPRGDDEEENRPTATTTPRSLLTRARVFLNPNSAATRSSSSADNHETNNSRRSMISPNISESMTELGSNLLLVPPAPPKIRVAVLIAMPSPSSSPSHDSSSTYKSASPLSSTNNNKARTTTSHSLGLSPTLKGIEEELEEQPRIPHLEMGVADVVLLDRRSDLG